MQKTVVLIDFSLEAKWKKGVSVHFFFIFNEKVSSKAARLGSHLRRKVSSFLSRETLQILSGLRALPSYFFNVSRYFLAKIDFDTVLNQKVKIVSAVNYSEALAGESGKKKRSRSIIKGRRVSM